MSRPRAFTLVELLCVVAIVASLAAILFPVLASTKSSAKGSVCLANLASIGRGLALYRADADDRYPYAIDRQVRENAASRLPFLTPGEIHTIPDIVDVLAPYVGDRRAFACPMDAGVNRDGPVPIANAFQTYGTSYAFFPILGAYDEAKGDPTTVVLTMDRSDKWHTRPDASFFEGRQNALLADGHVRSLSLASDHFTYPPARP